MTNVTIPALPAGTAPSASSPIESVEGGVSVRYAIGQLALSLSGGQVNGEVIVNNPSDPPTGILVAGSVNGVRLGTGTGGTANIDGVDNTGTVAYRPLAIGGNTLLFNISGTEWMRLDINGKFIIHGLLNAANDAAAAGLGVPVDGLYRNGSVVMVRVV